MILQNKKILIDGYNLELTQGTGIKTYGLTLIDVLQNMGAQVGVLVQKYRRGQARHMKVRVLKNLLGMDILAREINDDSIAKKKKKNLNNLDKTDYLIGLGDVFHSANILFKLLNKTTTIKTHNNLKFDIWHTTYQIPINIKNVKRITTIHDIIPMVYPGTSLDKLKFFRKSIQMALSDSQLIFTVSENTKKDILSNFDVQHEKIFVTYQPVAIKPFNKMDPLFHQYLKNNGLSDGKYFLFVGNIEPKKNLGRLLDAYAKIDHHYPLVVVGKKAWLWEDEISNRSINNVLFLDHISFNKLRILYSGAFCFIFPSLYEGFGLPPLEAFTCGCPVITSNNSSLREVCGDASLYVDAYDIMDIKTKIETVLGDSELRKKMIKLGFKRAQYFSLDNYKSKIKEGYEKLID